MHSPFHADAGLDGELPRAAWVVRATAVAAHPPDPTQRTRRGPDLAASYRVWEHFAHGADVGIRGRGATREEAFAEAARALTAVVTDVDSVVPRFAVPIGCDAPDDELLLVAWLDAVIYEMATRRLLFGRFDVCIEDHRLVAAAWGEPVDLSRHQPVVEPKGATMTALRVAREATWLAQTVIDV